MTVSVKFLSDLLVASMLPGATLAGPKNKYRMPPGLAKKGGMPPGIANKYALGQRLPYGGHLEKSRWIGRNESDSLIK